MQSNEINLAGEFNAGKNVLFLFLKIIYFLFTVHDVTQLFLGGAGQGELQGVAHDGHLRALRGHLNRARLEPVQLLRELVVAKRKKAVANGG